VLWSVLAIGALLAYAMYKAHKLLNIEHICCYCLSIVRSVHTQYTMQGRYR